jgi:DNA-directed RNA polymerase
MLFHAANLLDQDKLPLDARVDYAMERYWELYDIGVDPYNNTQWMNLDKPFSFLALCKEIVLLQNWTQAGNRQEDFVSNLPLFLDG